MSFFEYCLGDNRYSFKFNIGIAVFEEIENAFLNSLLQRECLTSAVTELPPYFEYPLSFELSLPEGRDGGYYYSPNNYSEQSYQNRYGAADSNFYNSVRSRAGGTENYFGGGFQGYSLACTDCGGFLYDRNRFFDGEDKLGSGEGSKDISDRLCERERDYGRIYGEENIKSGDRIENRSENWSENSSENRSFTRREKELLSLRYSLSGGTGFVKEADRFAPSLISRVYGEYASNGLTGLPLRSERGVELFSDKGFVGLDLRGEQGVYSFADLDFVGLALRGEQGIYGFSDLGVVGFALRGEQGFDGFSALSDRYQSGGASERVFECIKSDISAGASDCRLDLFMRGNKNTLSGRSRAFEALPDNPFFAFCGADFCGVVKGGYTDKSEGKLSSFSFDPFRYKDKNAFSEKPDGRLFPQSFKRFYDGFNYHYEFKLGFGAEFNKYFAADNSLVGGEREILGKQGLVFQNRNFAFGNEKRIYEKGKRELEALAYRIKEDELAFSKEFESDFSKGYGLAFSKGYETDFLKGYELAFLKRYFYFSQGDDRQSADTEPLRKLQRAVLWEKEIKKGFDEFDGFDRFEGFEGIKKLKGFDSFDGFEGIERLEGLLSISAPNMLLADDSNGRGADIGKLFLWEDEPHISPDDVKKIRNASTWDYCGEPVKAEIRVDMSGMKNIINRETDIDSLVADLTAAVSEAVASAAEGVHSL